MTTGQADDGAGARRARRLPAAERRETILRAAAAVFAEAGYRPARVRDVAARVGVSEPVIFQNFGSKGALFAAVVERAAAEARHSLDELASAHGAAPGQLLAHVLSGPGPGQAGRTADGGEEDDQAGTAYGVLFAEAAALAGEPELAGPVLDAVRAVAAHLADLVRHAQAAGAVRPDADPDATAWLLLSVLAARRLRSAAMPGRLEPDVAALALRALAPAEPGAGKSGLGR